MSKKTSNRVHLQPGFLADLARQLLDGDPIAGTVSGMELEPSSALYRARRSGLYTARLVYRDARKTLTLTIRGIEVAP